MANKLIHKKSSVITDNNPKLPQADSLEFGEIAINYADGYETISFKNTEHEIIEFRSKKYFEDIISENEEAVSQSLNNLNTRVEITQKAIESKQDKINDIEDIRTGAALGATALQSYTEKYKGTVTGVKINGTTKNPSSGVVDLGYINKQLSTSTSSTMTLSPNIYYRNTSTSLSTLTITLGSVSNSNIINEYFVEFTTSSSGTTVSLPSTIKWANGEQPKFDASTTYQISIVNNLGTIQKFK